MLTRAVSQAISQLHPNEDIARALHSILPLLAQHQLYWHDIGRNPDCQFASFIHATEEKVPEHEQIIQVRRAVRSWLLAHQLSLVDTVSEWRERVMAFGFATELRKQGNEHSLTPWLLVLQHVSISLQSAHRDITSRNTAHPTTYSLQRKYGCFT